MGCVLCSWMTFSYFTDVCSTTSTNCPFSPPKTFSQSPSSRHSSQNHMGWTASKHPSLSLYSDFYSMTLQTLVFLLCNCYYSSFWKEYWICKYLNSLWRIINVGGDWLFISLIYSIWIRILLIYCFIRELALVLGWCTSSLTTAC